MIVFFFKSYLMIRLLSLKYNNNKNNNKSFKLKTRRTLSSLDEEFHFAHRRIRQPTKIITTQISICSAPAIDQWKMTF